MKNKIFVFGSNLAGRHTKGDALTAFRQYGAIYGEGVGMHGNSYAIPTGNQDLKRLPLNKIERYVHQFLRFAQLNPAMEFHVTRIGCGFMGYEDAEIAPMFAEAPRNCTLPVGWRSYKKVPVSL